MAAHERPDHRARSYAPVARSSSTDSLEQRISATRRRSGELESRIATAPRFELDWISVDVLNGIAREYTAITGDPVRTDKKRRLIATCYRIHGSDFLPYVAGVFRAEKSARNLLWLLRGVPPRVSNDNEPDAVVAKPPADPDLEPAQLGAMEHRHFAMPCPAEECLPGLIYCAAHRPPFDPRSRRRYDRRPPNRDAADYFIAGKPDG